MEFSVIDYIVIVVYLIGVASLGVYAAGRQSSTADYFMGGNELPWWAVMFSVVATETSTLTFISIPAVAYGGNLTFLQITLGYIVGRILVSTLLLPAYFKGQQTTAYQFLEKRFGDAMRNAASTTFMITRLLADGVRLFATAIPLAIILRLGGAFTGWGNFELYLLAIAVISVITLVYTLIGGIKAVVWMDVMQMVVYGGGALLAIGIIIVDLPNGLGGALAAVAEASKTQVIYFGFDQSFASFIAQPYTFFTALIGGAIFSIASHGTDQLIVQRLLTTRNLNDGKKALVWSGVVVALQFALFLFIGLLLYVFYDAQSAAALGLTNSDEIFAKFIVEQLPVGLSGLVIASLFAAAMSSLSSSLNSLASSTTLDLYKPYFGQDNTKAEDLRISRIVTIVWAVILTGSAFIFAYMQLQAGERPAVVELGLSIASYTYGGLLGAFLLGRLFSQPDTTDAIIGFFVGLVSLLFMVKGPIQTLLPGNGLAIAWPLYTAVGSIIVILVGNISRWLRNENTTQFLGCKTFYALKRSIIKRFKSCQIQTQPPMLNRNNTVLALVDVQGKLAETVYESEQMLSNISKLIRGLQILDVPIIWLEQYPEGLGKTHEDIRKHLDGQQPITKMSFNACANADFTEELEALDRSQILVAGIETHVCVYQTARALKERNYEVEIVADAVSSRTKQNKQIALSKMNQLDIAPTSVEMALYELMEVAGTETFRKVLKVIK